jgi:GH25 family lysozyme M1 (1,4-beta-N-acetylmuramidase)
MTTPSLLVPDFSEWQGEVDWAHLVKGGFPAAIIRAYNGSRADHQWVRNRSQAHAHGIRALGLYSFLLPGGVGSINHQAQEFVGLVDKLQPGEWVICDYEAEHLHPDMLRTWIDYVGAHLHGTKPWAYAAEYLFRTDDLAGVVPATRTWLAAYGQREPHEGHELWQYTDHMTGLPGLGGHAVDCSTFHGSVEQLLHAVAGAPGPSGEPTQGPTTHSRFPFPVGIAPGKSNPSAEQLQAALQITGWLPHSVRRSPMYGPQTRTAVAGFNDKHHLNGVGTSHDEAIGPRGWALLMSLAYGNH